MFLINGQTVLAIIKPMSKFIILLVAFWLASCKSTPDKTGNHELPNIVILHVDDLGYHDLSCKGSQIYQTPHIDAFAKQAVDFTKAYANYPRCVPSRFAMLTASYPIQNGDVPDDGFAISNIPDEKNVIKAIKQAGYQTAYFGKFHLGDKNTIHKLGFQTTLGAGKAGSPISYFQPFNVPKRKNEILKKYTIPDLDNVSKKDEYLTDVLTNQAIKYLKNRDPEKPFMLMLSFYAVHQPLEAKQDDIARNKKEIAQFDFGNQPEYIKEGTGRTKMRQNNPVYAAMVENIDANIGRVLQTLKDLGLEQNTIVIISSDHGGLSNDGYKRRNLATSNFPLRAGKGWLYEGGVRVPLLVRWANHFKPHIDSTSIVTLMDVFPTLLDITQHTAKPVDGKSFLAVLKEKEKWANRTVYWHASHARPRNTGDSEASAIRMGDYKLIDFYKQGKVELYNIKKDISEQHDLSEKMPEKKAQLLQKLQKWKKENKLIE